MLKEKRTRNEEGKSGMDSAKKTGAGVGKFIAMEGIDGSGKSTQIKMLYEKMKKEGMVCYTTMEPTDSPIGSLIRQVLTGRLKMDNRALAALFVADRLDHLLNDVNGLVHKISDGVNVITDRYYFSSYAYHSVDMPMEWVIKANEQSSNILRPAVTIFIDISPDAALERITKNRFQKELFEEKNRLTQVREKYMEAFELLKAEENVVIVDGDRSEQEIADDIWERVKGYLK